MSRFKKSDTNFLIYEIKDIRSFIVFCLREKIHIDVTADYFYLYISQEEISMETVKTFVISQGFEKVIKALFFWKPETALLLYEITVAINTSNRFRDS